MSHELEHEYGESVRPADEIVIEIPKNEVVEEVKEIPIELPKNETIIPAEEIVVELPKNETLIPVEEVVYRELPQTGSPLFLIGIALILAGVMIKRLYHFKWSK